MLYQTKVVQHSEPHTECWTKSDTMNREANKALIDFYKVLATGRYMPRLQRIKGEFSTYHVMQRGNEKKNIFRNDKDKSKFLEIISKVKEKYNFKVYAYCLMDNHVHLVINDNGNDISMLMKSINVSYVIYFNRIHERVGHLFQDRFRSELVKDDRYLLEVSRYIHNNPVKAKIVGKPSEFKWSSYNIYSGKANDDFGLLEISKILGLFKGSRTTSVSEYEKFVAQYGEEIDNTILDIDEEVSDFGQENNDRTYKFSLAKVQIEQMLAEENITMEKLLENKSRRNEMIRTLRKKHSLNLKDIGGLFGGLSESQISRIVVD